MNCSDCEQLFDAYLDGKLTGALRLEFDAHRLRCRRCQQTLAMLESVGHVLATDEEAPELRPNFSDNVMRRIHVRQSIRPRTIRFPLRRVALVSAALVQAAAVLVVALVWTHQPDRPSPIAPQPSATPETVVANSYAADPEYLAHAEDPGFRAVFDMIREGVEDGMWDAVYAGGQLTSDAIDLAVFLNLTLPEEYVRDAEKVAGNPLLGIFGPVAPDDEESEESTGAADEIHSI
jgi:hypothetical protein